MVENKHVYNLPGIGQVVTAIKVPDEFIQLLKPIDQIKQDSDNPNRMSKRKRESLWNSLQSFGWFKPIIEDKAGLLADGAQRIQVLQEHGEKYAPVLNLEIDDVNRRLLRQVANKLRGEHDPELDALEYKKIDAAGQRRQLIRLLQLNEKELIDALTKETGVDDPEKLPPLDQVKTDIKPGDIIELGDHVIACGDATDQELLNKILGDRKINLIATDPPYGFDYEDTIDYRERTLHKGGNERENNTIIGDGSTVDLPKLLEGFLKSAKPHLAPYNAYYITFASSNIHILVDAILKSGYTFSQLLVWVKGSSVLSRSDYHYAHEEIAFGGTKPKAKTKPPMQHDQLAYGWGERHKFYGRFESTVWYIPRPSRNPYHPTMKPVELYTRAITNSTLPGDTVLDSFLGSGTAIIACEQTERRCVGIELDPRYVQIACDRWTRYTGEVATKR